MFRPAWILLALAAWHLARAALLQAAPADDFGSKIAPLLARRCLGCHNATDRKGGLDLSSARPALAGGDTGTVLTPGEPDQSVLWERVSANEMPPKKPLGAEEQELIRQWIKSGAKWGTDPIDRFRYTSDSRAGYDWWAFQPIRRPEPPNVKQETWPAGDIDRFVLAKLEASGLSPAPPADKRTLIRRLSFDLLGLPPTPEEVADFLADNTPDSYVRLVNRLLDSPHYGERWGRHWLDIARFGESQGFERDKLRPNSWQYRDWVVWAFNHDLPYDEFVRLQLAGDVLYPNDPRATIATGFLVAAPWDEVGQTQQSAAMKEVVRQDELEDVIAVVGQTFLGLTANCARCHDHKFDPISQSEYYSLAAVFAGSRHGERESLSEAGKIQFADQARELQGRLTEIEHRLQGIDNPIRNRLITARAGRPAPVVEVPRPISCWEFNDDLRDSVGSLHGTAQGHARLEGGRLILDGDDSFVASAPLEKELSAKTLEVWVALSRLDQQGGAAISVQSSSGAVFDAIVYGEREPGQWMAGSNGYVRSQSLMGPVETADDKQTVQMVLVYSADQTIAAYRNGRPYGQAYKASSLATFEPLKAQIVFGLRHNPPGGNRMLAGTIDRAALYDRALSPDEVAALAGVPSETVTDDQILAELSPAERAQRARLARDRSQIQTELRLISGGKVYAISPSAPEPTHLLERGNPRQKGALAVPGALRAATGLSADLGLPADAAEAARRAKLAHWITDPRQPLTPRVIANRLWHYHFGAGIVETPNDFGFNGSRPSHPELLDWLAAELVAPATPQPVATESAGGTWSLKRLHRLIVTSATYRQSSRMNPAAGRVDAGNRLLWRRSPQRLEAEAVRDSILSVAGELNPTLGGPGFQDFKTFTFNSQFYEPVDPVGYPFHRRSIYRTWVRSGRSDFLDAFDCPDPSTTSPRRAVTTTPLQALALLNNSFTLRMAERFAERAQREAPGTAENQARRVFDLAFARSPTDEEQAASVRFVSEFGLAAFCRVVFNSNEFLYID